MPLQCCSGRVLRVPATVVQCEWVTHQRNNKAAASTRLTAAATAPANAPRSLCSEASSAAAARCAAAAFSFASASCWPMSSSSCVLATNARSSSATRALSAACPAGVSLCARISGDAASARALSRCSSEELGGGDAVLARRVPPRAGRLVGALRLCAASVASAAAVLALRCSTACRRGSAATGLGIGEGAAPHARCLRLS